MDQAIVGLTHNMVKDIDWGKAKGNSYRNFHAEGLHYINLLRTERLVVKLYIFKNVVHNEWGYLVWPHNHRYAFNHVTLIGSINNHIFECDAGDDWRLFTFDTPLNGGTGLKEVWKVGLNKIERSKYKAGQGYFLAPDQVHTLSVDDDYAAALLFQYQDVPGNAPSIMLAHRDAPDPECSGRGSLYTRMDLHHGTQLVEEFRDRWSG